MINRENGLSYMQIKLKRIKARDRDQLREEEGYGGLEKLKLSMCFNYLTRVSPVAEKKESSTPQIITRKSKRAFSHTCGTRPFVFPLPSTSHRHNESP